MDAGIEVLLDKWDLREGADTHAYMEKCVSDKSVTHVLIFSDSEYAKKADNRSGGVGKETLIITPDVYGQEDVTSKEQRYIPIVMEKNESGKAFLPVYIKGRYYIDMSTDEYFVESLEQLVRTIYGKPLHKKPKLGKVPAYITADTSVVTGLSTYKTSAISAVREIKPYALSRCREYFETFAQNLDELRLNNSNVGNDFDDIVISKIESMQDMKNECIDVISSIVKNFDSPDAGELIHDFFENIVDYTQWPEGLNQWQEIKSDHFKFILHEIFLYTVSYSLKYNNGVILKEILSGYYCRIRLKKELTSYAFFVMGMRSLEHRNSKLALGRLSLRADMLSDGVKSRIDIKFNDIMQADLFLFLHSRIASDGYHLWRPVTLVFADHYNGPFELFARAQSKKRCDALLKMLGCDSLEKFKGLFIEGDPVMKHSPTGWHGEFDIRIICAVDTLGSID